MSVITMAQLEALDARTRELGDDLFIIIDDPAIDRCLRIVRARLKGYLDVAKTQDPPGFVRHHGDEPPEPFHPWMDEDVPDDQVHPSNRFYDEDTPPF